MKESEAIEKLKNMRLFMQIEDKNNGCKFTEDDYKANEMAIQALEEVQQYRAIGTPEECRALKDRLVAKKVSLRHVRKFVGFDDGKCPTCGESVSRDFDGVDVFCPECGQRLDWSDEE